MASTKQDAALLVFESLNAKHVFFFLWFMNLSSTVIIIVP